MSSIDNLFFGPFGKRHGHNLSATLNGGLCTPHSDYPGYVLFIIAGIVNIFLSFMVSIDSGINIHLYNTLPERSTLSRPHLYINIVKLTNLMYAR